MLSVSVVTGTYNRLPLLKQMVASVRASIMPRLSYEIIVVDGGSEDGTIAWCKMQRDIVLIEQKRLVGAIKAFAAGFDVARGQYVVIGNDDLVFNNLSITRALSFMEDNPTVGIGLFYTNRGNRFGYMHVAQMPAHYPGGTPTSVPYGGICIIPKFLGDRLDWWFVPGAHTYGGDNALCARALEAGWRVEGIPDASVYEAELMDELKEINNPPRNDSHPDTQAYLRLFPNGPCVRYDNPPPEYPEGWHRPVRSLHAPIFESGHRIQHQQKRALTTAMARLGQCVEVDYAEVGADEILRVAEAWKPDLAVLQLHYAQPFTVWHARKLREILPASKIVVWNGDVYDRSNDDTYIDLLRSVDLIGVVNATARDNYRAKGIRAEYWQVPYEADGVGHDPLPDTPAYDILFMGNGYSVERIEFAKFLREVGQAKGWRVGIYGNYPGGIANGENLYNFQEGCRLLRNAKVVLADGHNRAWGSAYGFTSNRMFQSLAAGGAMLLQQDFPGMTDLLGFVGGTHLMLWENEAELILQLKDVLDPSFDELRQKIARQGQLEVLKHHSGDARMRELLIWLTPHGEHDPTLANFHGARNYA